jgi:tetratricopeptide (TPR) repeat protein
VLKLVGRRRRLTIWGSIFLVGILLTVGLSAVPAEKSDLETLLAEADTAYDRWSGSFDFDAYEPLLRSAIDCWEDALSLIPATNVQTRSHALSRLAQAYFELAVGYLDRPAEREAAFEAGKDAALANLNLDPVFVAVRERNGFRAALRAASDVAAIFWYGNNLGQWLDFHRFTAFFGGVRDVHAAFERAIELDETYDGGGPHRSMAALLAQAHFLVGRSRADAVAHFERSIEIDPGYLESYVNYAEYYAEPTGDVELFDALLDRLFELSGAPTVVAAWPFYNRLATERAIALRGVDP